MRAYSALDQFGLAPDGDDAVDVQMTQADLDDKRNAVRQNVIRVAAVRSSSLRNQLHADTYRVNQNSAASGGLPVAELYAGMMVLQAWRNRKFRQFITKKVLKKTTAEEMRRAKNARIEAEEEARDRAWAAQRAKVNAAKTTRIESHATSGGGDTVFDETHYIGVPDEDSAERIQQLMAAQAEDSSDEDDSIIYGRHVETGAQISHKTVDL